MGSIIQHSKEIFILFIFPIIGLIIESFFSEKIVKRIVVITSIILIPIITSYYYVIPYVYRLSALILCGSLYSFYSRQIIKQSSKIISAVFLSILLFVVLGILAFIDGFSGYQRVKQTWYSGHYRIDHIEDQGFAGKALYKYELNRTTIIPFFIKKIDTRIDEDSIEDCSVNFVENKIKFNNCNGIITKVAR